MLLDLEPECGGTIRALYLTSSSEPVHLLRPTPAEAIAAREVGSTACYPLVPFSNRIKDGLFSFRNQQYRIAPNRLPHPHPMHGHGWQGSWEVERRAAEQPVAALLDSRASVHMALGEPEKALADMADALADAETPVRLFHQAQAYEQAGQYE